MNSMGRNLGKLASSEPARARLANPNCQGSAQIWAKLASTRAILAEPRVCLPRTQERPDCKRQSLAEPGVCLPSLYAGEVGL